MYSPALQDPDASLEELSVWLDEEVGVFYHPSIICRVLKIMDLNLKRVMQPTYVCLSRYTLTCFVVQMSRSARERDATDRGTFVLCVMDTFKSNQICWIDETTKDNRDTHRKCGRAHSGQRVCKVMTPTC